MIEPDQRSLFQLQTTRNQTPLEVSLQNPRNALNSEMRKALLEVWKEFRDADTARAAVLTGPGDNAFCAGDDLKEIGGYYKSMTTIERRETGQRTPRVGDLSWNLDPRKPVIAAINEPCLAGGLALACEIRIAVVRLVVSPLSEQHRWPGGWFQGRTSVHR